MRPDMVGAILAEPEPVHLTAETLIKRTDLPPAWTEQKAPPRFI
jgi:hypothetical protein